MKISPLAFTAFISCSFSVELVVPNGRALGTARKQTTLNGAGAVRSSRVLVDPAREARQLDVPCSAARGGPRAPKWARPITQRAESPSELNAGVHQVSRAGFSVRHSGTSENGAEHVRPPAVERAQIERREQPLVRVDDDRVRHVPSPRCGRNAGRSPPTPACGVTCNHSPFAFADAGVAATGSTLVVDVVPSVATTRAAGRRRRGRRRSRTAASPGACGTRRRRQLPRRRDRGRADHRLVDRRCAGPSSKRAGGRSAARPLRADVGDGRFARGGERVQAADRRRGKVADDPFESVGQAHQRSQPAERDLLPAPSRRRRAPASPADSARRRGTRRGTPGALT